MIGIEIIENIVNAFIEHDSKKMIGVLEDYLKKANKSGNVLVSKKLRNLITKIPSRGKTYSPSSAYSARANNEVHLNPLVHFSDSTVGLEEVILNEINLKNIKDFVREWENKDKLQLHDMQPVNKLIFYGPPGTGKTKLATAIANKLDYPLVTIQLDELISAYLGKTGKNIKEIFDIARSQKVVIFLDEIDTVAKHRDDDSELGELKRVVTVLLQNIDSFPNESILIAATNHEHLLDKALWRRFQRRFSFNIPGTEEREKLFRLFLDGYDLSSDQYRLFAEATSGFSGSSINDFCDQLKRRSILEGERISEKNFLTELLSFLNASNDKSTLSKKQRYVLCKKLKAYGLPLTEISHLSGIPYTTLIDNLA